MNSWPDRDLQSIGDATELDLASRRDDATLSAFVTMWVVRVGDDLYVRSAGGPDRPWYRRAQARRTGTIRAGGLERDVTFTDASDGAHPAIDAAYHDKYDTFGPGPVGHVTGAEAVAVTIRLVPNDRTD